MRHKISGRKFDRPSDERRALFRMLVGDLMRHERLKTTEAKAKEMRPLAEKMITLGKDGTVHARRQAMSYINDKDVVKKLFDEIAPRFKDRPGGYTRIIKRHERRLGDAGKTAFIELLKAGETKARTRAERAPAPVVSAPPVVAPPPAPAPTPPPVPQAEAPKPEEQKAPETPPPAAPESPPPAQP